VRVQAQRVLELDPSHAGASYMLGRIHSSIKRMGGFKKFMARQLYGGEALEGASWDEAQRLLEVAVREDPCVPEHHFELARVYEARGDAEGAARAIASVRELTGDATDRRAARLRERVDELSRKL
jgi:predicted Zn-dependent protease